MRLHLGARAEVHGRYAQRIEARHVRPGLFGLHAGHTGSCELLDERMMGMWPASRRSIHQLDLRRVTHPAHELREHVLRLARWREAVVDVHVVFVRNDVAAAAGVPAFKANSFAASCRKYGWPQLAGGFRELLAADRAFKTSSPNVEAYFDILLWKLVG